MALLILVLLISLKAFDWLYDEKRLEVLPWYWQLGRLLMVVELLACFVLFFYRDDAYASDFLWRVIQDTGLSGALLGLIASLNHRKSGA